MADVDPPWKRMLIVSGVPHDATAEDVAAGVSELGAVRAVWRHQNVSCVWLNSG